MAPRRSRPVSDPGFPAIPPPLPQRGGLTGRIIFLWLVIVGCVAYTAIDNYLSPPSVAAAAAEERNPGDNLSPELAMSSRYAVGAWSLNRANPAPLLPVLARLDQLADSPVEKIRLAIVVGEIEGAPDAIQRINALKPSLAHDLALQRDADDVLQIYKSGVNSLPADQQQRLINRHGWFGRVALAYNAPPGSPADQAVFAPARRTLAVIGVFGVLILFAFIAGLGLCCLAIIRLALRKVQFAYRPPIVNVVPLLESFALYLAMFAVAGPVFHHLPLPAGAAGVAIRLVASAGIAILPIVWPMLRGMRFDEWRRVIGWHAGRGVFREIGVGLLAYIGGLPVIAIGFLLTFILSSVTNSHPTHPITRMIGQSPGLTLELLFLASIFAPITEETLFRGALFGYLRGWHRWLVSATIVSTIFAALHPQGWIAMPALFSIAIVFAAMREWRSSLLPSMAAHCLNNTVLLVLLTVSLS
jgi:membrane protease YdiL (CAAX protease family)